MLEAKLKTTLIKNGQSYLLLIPKTKDYEKMLLDLLYFMVNDNMMPGIYITVNKPFEEMRKMMMRRKIYVELVLFIDAISKSLGFEVPELCNECTFIDHPRHLTDICIALNESLNALNESVPEKGKFMVFDNMSNLLHYTNIETIEKFTEFISNRVEQNNTNGIILMISSKNEQALIDRVSKYVDEKITIGG